VRKLLVLCVVLASSFLSLRAPRPTVGQDASLKANLDLPYNAQGDAEEEEDAPEVVVFFGQSYEANALVFALDQSGSMSENGRWQLQTREVNKAISELTERVDLGVVYYSSTVNAFREVPIRAIALNKTAAHGYIASRQPAGDTCLAEGLVKALEIVRKSEAKHKVVVVTSDGKPDICATGHQASPSEIEGLIQKTVAANPGRQVTVHTIWVGAGTDNEAITFMKKLAAAHGGTFRQVSK